MSYNAGTAFIQIVPSLAGVVERIEEAATGWGKDASEAFKRALNIGTSDASIGPSDESAAHQGESAGGKFADSFRARIDAALRALPSADVQLDDDAASAKLMDLRARLETLRNVDIGVDISDDDALAALDLIRADADELGHKSESIRIKVDAAQAVTELAAVGAAADAASGAEGGGGGISGLLSGMGDVGPAVSPAILAIGGLVTALIPVAGVAAGAVSTLPAMMAGAGLGMGALYLGFHGLTTAIKAYTAAQNTAGETAAQVATKQRDLAHAMAGLSPAAQTFVSFVGGTMLPMFHQWQAAVQGALLPALTTAFQTLTPVFGVLEKFLVRAATGIGGLVDQFAKWLSSSQGLTLLNQLLTAGWGFMEQMGGILVATIIPAFAQIAVAAVPILQAMGREAQKLAYAFSKWVAGGGFTRFVQWVMAHGQQVVTDLLKLAGAALKIIVAFAPFGGVVLTIVTAVTELVSWLTRSWQVFTAIIGVVGAAALAITLSSLPITAIGIAIAALVVAGIELAAHWSAVWSGIKAVAGAAWHWLDGNVFQPIVGFFTGLPTQIGNVLSTIGEVIYGPFVWAFNEIKRLWNDTVGSISFTIPSWIPGIGGHHFGFPKMRATGGPAEAGMPYIVGERGPELFVPSVPGVIVPHQDLTDTARPEPVGAKAMRSLTINNNVTAYDPRTAAMESMKLASWTAKTKGF